MTGDWAVEDRRHLRRSGNSVVFTIPPKVLVEMQLEPGDELEIVASREEGVITMRPVTDSEK